MDRVFSVDDIADQFWSPPPIHLAQAATEEERMMMNRSSSEWALQRFLQEASASETSLPPSSVSASAGGVGGGASSSRPGNGVLEIKDHQPHHQAMTGTTTASFNSAPLNIPIDSEEYQAFLKSRLNLACAAVALTRASYVKSQDSAAVTDNGSQASNTSRLASQAPSKADALDNTTDKLVIQP